jgi:hypothetical protein
MLFAAAQFPLDRCLRLEHGHVPPSRPGDLERWRGKSREPAGTTSEEHDRTERDDQEV